MDLKCLVLKAISHVMHFDNVLDAPAPESLTVIFRAFLRSIHDKNNSVTANIKLTDNSSRKCYERRRCAEYNLGRIVHLVLFIDGEFFSELIGDGTLLVVTIVEFSIRRHLPLLSHTNKADVLNTILRICPSRAFTLWHIFVWLKLVIWFQARPPHGRIL